MSEDNSKMQPWQVFQAARKYLGPETVAKIFHKEKRSAYNWAQDPAFTECRCRNPLELLYTLFERMDTVGLGYVVRAALVYLSGAVEAVDEGQEIRQPLATIQQEILADYAAVANLQRAIESEASLEEVRYCQREAIAEIERTVARYAKEHGHDC